MAAIANDTELDLNVVCKKLQESLPAYARPLFIRLLHTVDTTGKMGCIKIKRHSIEIFKLSFYI